jgi:hypothetical protein
MFLEYGEMPFKINIPKILSWCQLVQNIFVLQTQYRFSETSLGPIYNLRKSRPLWPLIYFQQHGGLPAKDMGTITDECEAE